MFTCQPLPLFRVECITRSCWDNESDVAAITDAGKRSAKDKIHILTAHGTIIFKKYSNAAEKIHLLF